MVCLISKDHTRLDKVEFRFLVVRENHLPVQVFRGSSVKPKKSVGVSETRKARGGFSFRVKIDDCQGYEELTAHDPALRLKMGTITH